MTRPTENLTATTPEAARERCFGPSPDARWDRPGRTLAARKVAYSIHALIFRSSLADAHRPDIFQRVYTASWQHFPEIWQSFLKSKRAQDWGSFESHFERFVAWRVNDEVDRVRREYGEQPGKKRPAGSTGSSGAVIAMRLQPTDLDEVSAPSDPRPSDSLVWTALERLPPDLRALLEERLAAGKTPAEIGASRMRSAKTISNGLTQAKRLLIHELHRAATIEYLELHPEIRAATSEIARLRCERLHECLIYAVACRHARDANAMWRHSARLESERDANAKLTRLHRAVADALRVAGLPLLLDDCLHQEHAGEPARRGVTAHPSARVRGQVTP